ncbi:O-antigen ligase family protein [Poritiphilus flavus]|uniref:O-antigen ligase-related domain-containing protein n=1 Tax=Poritiphilus flavus TaxID=2697053 RepID=A0A6L9E8N3_9FLAO|nr:O-antigen ligase family protein [Poritiphilus flavus]NAS10971.1 hypothetical protein [Poritiphilus flavus]
MENVKIGENKAFSVYSLVLLLAIYGGIVITSVFGNLGNLSVLDIGPLALPSLGLFVLICLLAVWRRKLYFLFLVFAILAFPAPIDDLFISVPLTNPDDRTQVVFPMITRIDLYLILGILLGVLGKGGKLRVIKFSLSLKVLLVLFLFVFLVNIFKSLDLWDFNLLLAYSFHLRYAILFLVLLQLYDIKNYQKELINGFVISLVFLLLEAYINTLMRGSTRLLSGSLSLNSFANISAAISLFVIVLLRHRQIKRSLGIFTLAVAMIILIGSATRGAFLTLILAYFLMYLLGNHRKIVLNTLRVAAGVALLLGAYVWASRNSHIPDRYSYQEIAKKIDINLSKNSLNEVIKIKSSRETNSIKSRIDLFDASLNMVVANPVTGIGVGRWNRHKNLYSENDRVPRVLLDTHNDYLALVSQYGIPLGLLFSWLIFFYPFYLHAKSKQKETGPLSHLYVINFAMGIAALSNSGFFKHQIAALLLMCFCITLQLHKDYAKAD